ncbi:MAG: PD40 domain-containing protein [Acidobacteriaceae bacterium]|nr:PD40 domain-containing protein [Acidobacteriaceae bacterium]
MAAPHGMSLLSISPDGSELLIAGHNLPSNLSIHIGPTFTGPLFSLPVLGGSPRRLGSAIGRDAAWSPDGKTLVFTNGSDVFLAKRDGTEPRKLTSVSGSAFSPAWSPDGTVVRFSALDARLHTLTLWEVSVQGTNLHRMLADWHNPPSECCGKWAANGKSFVFSSQGQIWAISEHRGILRRVTNDPVQLTSSPLSLSDPLPSKDGKKLFAVGQILRGELVRYDAKTRQFAPFLSGISAEFVASSKDRQFICYVTYPEGILWRSRFDGSDRLQLSYPPLYAVQPRWSPDGKQIIFFSPTPSGKPQRIYTISSEGGSARQLIPDDSKPESDPNWSPDGSKIVFSDSSGQPDGGIRIFDMSSGQISTLPGSRGFYSPRWSPDGRYILAMTLDTRHLLIFDSQTKKWSELLDGAMGFPSWSKDGRYIYLLKRSLDCAVGGNCKYDVLRVRISDRKVELVADLKDVKTTGHYAIWLGLDPDDSPMLLRDTGSQDIYALDWQAP